MRPPVVSVVCWWVLAALPALAQQYTALLDLPFEWRRLPRVQPRASDSCTVLQMAYASAVIRNPDAWPPALRANREVYRVELVYTYYPSDTARWITPYGRLMPQRLENLFALDPSLRDPNLHWRLTAQTAPRTGSEAQGCFHGILIWHRPRGGQPPNAPPPVVVAPSAVGPVGGGPPVDAAPSDTLTQAARSGGEQATAAPSTAVPPRRSSLADRHVPDELEDTGSDYQKLVRREMRMVRGILAGTHPLEDSSVYRVLSRQTGWGESLVVMDWTGSMYAYGAQLVRWHQDNLPKGVVKFLSIFNDGDDRRGRDPMEGKPVGKTGGIYFLEPQNLEQIIATMELVMTNGDGGDLPENDLEAVLVSIRQYPSAARVILIADRESKVRDMPLLPQIDRPLLIIPCGLGNEIHPDYLQIAWFTGGSILLGRDELHFSEPRARVKRNMVRLGGVRYSFDPVTQLFSFADKPKLFPWPRQ